MFGLIEEGLITPVAKLSPALDYLLFTEKTVDYVRTVAETVRALQKEFKKEKRCTKAAVIVNYSWLRTDVFA